MAGTNPLLTLVLPENKGGKLGDSEDEIGNLVGITREGGLPGALSRVALSPILGKEWIRYWV